MNYQNILYEKKEGVAIITINRPEVLNAINEDTLNELIAALDEADGDDEVGVIILTGAGEKAWSAGRDLKSISQTKEKPGGARYRKLEEISKPVIAAVNGYCLTGAFELAMCADIIIASENAKFGDTHAKYGLLPGGGASQRLPRQIGPKRAKELFFTCTFIDSKRAVELGIANKVVPADKLMEASMETARAILANDRNSIRAIKSLVNEGLKGTLEDGLKMEQRHHSGSIATIGDSKQRLRQFVEKRENQQS